MVTFPPFSTVLAIFRHPSWRNWEGSETRFNTPPPLEGKIATDTLTSSPAPVVYKISGPVGGRFLYTTGADSEKSAVNFLKRISTTTVQKSVSQRKCTAIRHHPGRPLISWRRSGDGICAFKAWSGVHAVYYPHQDDYTLNSWQTEECNCKLRGPTWGLFLYQRVPINGH